ncbi:MAG: hypothetical protein KatS3mg057_2055 [Herpetosiphonaceae bacterium]|nr:MAG: hypothetical protein KatS3mg057_2055 [Herpetosiphonaceae bacterium]
MSVSIVNLTRGTVLAESAELAASFLARGLGLMGRRRLSEGGGLILYPTNNIHMLFMRFPIDAVFVDREHYVVGVRPHLRPWISIAWCGQARYTIELPVGTIAASATEIGDRLELTPPLR